jgi:hypothetical protein
VAGFLAGYGGSTRVSYAADLRLFAAWCHEAKLNLFIVRRAHLELYGRWLEETGRMRSTVARRLSTLASFYKYAEQEDLVDRNPALNVALRLAPMSNGFLRIVVRHPNWHNGQVLEPRLCAAARRRQGRTSSLRCGRSTLTASTLGGTFGCHEVLAASWAWASLRPCRLTRAMTVARSPVGGPGRRRRRASV